MNIYERLIQKCNNEEEDLTIEEREYLEEAIIDYYTSKLMDMSDLKLMELARDKGVL